MSTEPPSRPVTVAEWLAQPEDARLELIDGDLAGWRRDRVPAMPRERPVTVRPDWLCEIVSESNRATDTIKKLRRYQQAGVPHYWILDQSARALTVYRNHADGYVIVLAAEAGERVRAEPFDAIELEVAALFGEE